MLMYDSQRGSRSRPGLTRISVTGTRDGFLVRAGDDRPRAVRSSGGRLVCDCGIPGCAHVEAVMLCGFVEDAASEQRAA
jgi:hypothetical protein